MSGIVGILNIDRDPVDRELLGRMTSSMTFRGPDAQEIWVERNVGFGHTMLRTTREAEKEMQPLSFDGQVWLTADARIDDRGQLISKLETKLGKPLVQTRPATKGLAGKDHSGLSLPNDAELILHAYEAWGTDCVEHLIGDFVFAIWDAPERRLFCARDHLGVRQLYYSLTKRSLVFSNTLNCVRLHPDVSQRLNELAIGDFLLFGLNQEPATTTFADVQKLPRAHSLTFVHDRLQLQQYWTPRLYSFQTKNKSGYVENLRQLLGTAVEDRLRTDRLGISLSGGIDSSAVAATARQLLQKSSAASEMRAFCVAYDGVFADNEREYATKVATALGISLEVLEGNEINKGDSQRTLGSAPEPFNVEPFYVISDEILRRIACETRVALTGWDGDTFLSETPKHTFAYSLKNRDVRRLTVDLMRYVFYQRALPPVGVRTRLKRLRSQDLNANLFPVWLQKDFSKRWELAERWREVMSKPAHPHPTRPHAFRILSSPDWSALFARFDSNVTSLPLEVRHPLIDVRVVEYLLSVPVIPWMLDKTILRKAMVGVLPDTVRLRPKSPLSNDPGLQLTGSQKFRQIDSFKPIPEILAYIDRNAVPPVSAEEDSNRLWLNVRPFSLNQWLINSLSLS